MGYVEKPRDRAVVFVFSVFLAVTAFAQPAAEADWQRPATRWLDLDSPSGAPDLPAMIAHLSALPPETDVLLMLGDRTAVAWNMQKWFSDFRAANVAFGDAYVTDTTYFVDALVLPYEPSTIVMDIGRPDVEAGKTPDQTVADIQELVATIQETLSETQFVVLSLRSTDARLSTWSALEETNRQLEQWASRADQPDVHYVDLATVTLDRDGYPLEAFKGPSQLAFLEWSLVVKPVVYAAQERYRMLKGCDRWGCGAQR